MNPTRNEKDDLFSKLLGVCVTSASIAGLVTGGALGLIVAATSSCMSSAIILMPIGCVAGAVLGFLIGVITGLAVATECSGYFTPLHNKRRFGWIVTSQSFVVTITAALLLLRRMGVFENPLGGDSVVGISAALALIVWVWVSRRLDKWYSNYYDALAMRRDFAAELQLVDVVAGEHGRQDNNESGVS
jgi:hypothetical protein